MIWVLRVIFLVTSRSSRTKRCILGIDFCIYGLHGWRKLVIREGLRYHGLLFILRFWNIFRIRSHIVAGGTWQQVYSVLTGFAVVSHEGVMSLANLNLISTSIPCFSRNSLQAVHSISGFT